MWEARREFAQVMQNFVGPPDRTFLTEKKIHETCGVTGYRNVIDNCLRGLSKLLFKKNNRKHLSKD